MWIRPSNSSGSKRLKSSQIPRPWRDAADRIGAGEQKEKTPQGATPKQQYKDMEKYLQNNEAKVLAGLLLELQEENPEYRVSIEKEKSRWDGQQVMNVTVRDRDYNKLTEQRYIVENPITANDAFTLLKERIKAPKETEK